MTQALAIILVLGGLGLLGVLSSLFAVAKPARTPEPEPEEPNGSIRKADGHLYLTYPSGREVRIHTLQDQADELAEMRRNGHWGPTAMSAQTPDPIVRRNCAYCGQALNGAVACVKCGAPVE